MKIKQKVSILGIMTLIGFGGIFLPATVQAATQPQCGGVPTSIISCDQRGGGSSQSQNGIWGILLLVINIMTAGVGILAVAGIVYGSVMYASAGGSAEQVKKAREIITNVVIGIIAYILMYALLNFLIPGGLFK